MARQTQTLREINEELQALRRELSILTTRGRLVRPILARSYDETSDEETLDELDDKTEEYKKTRRLLTEHPNFRRNPFAEFSLRDEEREQARHRAQERPRRKRAAALRESEKRKRAALRESEARRRARIAELDARIAELSARRRAIQESAERQSAERQVGRSQARMNLTREEIRELPRSGPFRQEFFRRYPNLSRHQRIDQVYIWRGETEPENADFFHYDQNFPVAFGVPPEPRIFLMSREERNGYADLIPLNLYEPGEAPSQLQEARENERRRKERSEEEKEEREDLQESKEEEPTQEERRTAAAAEARRDAQNRMEDDEPDPKRPRVDGSGMQITISSPMVLGAGKENAEDRFPTTLGAHACDLAYRMLERNRLANVQQIQKELKELRKTIGNWTLEVKYSDKNMITLSQGQLLLIAHRGTDTSGRRTTRDVGSDLALAVGAEGTNKEFQIRLDRTTNIIQANPNKTILCTGHSLGGTTINYCLAKSAYIRKRLGFCRTFNAGASPFVSKVSAATKKKLDPLVRHHRINGDVVSASFLVNTPFGKVKTKDPTSSSTANYLRYIPGVVGLAANATLALDAHALTHWF